MELTLKRSAGPIDFEALGAFLKEGAWTGPVDQRWTYHYEALDIEFELSLLPSGEIFTEMPYLRPDYWAFEIAHELAHLIERFDIDLCNGKKIPGTESWFEDLCGKWFKINDSAIRTIFLASEQKKREFYPASKEVIQHFYYWNTAVEASAAVIFLRCGTPSSLTENPRLQTAGAFLREDPIETLPSTDLYALAELREETPFVRILTRERLLESGLVAPRRIMTGCLLADDKELVLDGFEVSNREELVALFEREGSPWEKLSALGVDASMVLPERLFSGEKPELEMSVTFLAPDESGELTECTVNLNELPS